jgi:hypothetical protein
VGVVLEEAGLKKWTEPAPETCVCVFFLNLNAQDERSPKSLGMQIFSSEPYRIVGILKKDSSPSL